MKLIPVLGFLLFAATVHAQDLPNKPEPVAKSGNSYANGEKRAALFAAVPSEAKPKHFYQDKKFWLGEAVIGLSIFLDYHSTAVLGQYTESSPLLGPHPSAGRIAGVGLGDFFFESGLNLVSRQLMKDDPNKYWRFAGYTAQPAISLGLHLSAAIHNYRLPGQ